MYGKCKFSSLGLMLDCSRNAVMTVTELKKFIKLLSKLGYNRFMLYTEDTYEVDGEEFFGHFRGRYTQDELKELDNFAYENGVEMIPCIQTLAHFTALIRWPKYAAIKDMDDILLVGDERTYQLIDRMISSLRKCFRTDKIHIGMDEAHNLGKGKYRDINGEVDRTEILLYHLNRVCGITEKYGFKPMMWSDMFYRIASGGEYYSVSSKFDPSIKAKIPQNLSLVYWDYYHIDKSFYDGMIKGHKQLSENIVFAGGAWKWASFVPNNSLSIVANKKAFEACIENNVKDVFITLWGDNGAECSPYAVLPTIVSAACVAHGITDENEIKDCFKKIIGCDYDDFMMLDLPDKSENIPLDYVVNPCKYQLYNDCFFGIYDSGVETGDGEYYAGLAKKLSDAALRANQYFYIFDTISKLCSALEIKSEIGSRTHNVYKNKDKKELDDLIADYEEMIERTKALYYAFRKQWFNENKANGFEVHDIRLGGLIMRMQSCRDRLADYRDGKIDLIPELEENTLPLIKKKEIVYSWSNIVTANIL